MPQNWKAFSADEHQRWDLLYARHAEGVAPYASQAFLKGLDVLKFDSQGIPDFDILNAQLRTATGWEVVAVPGLIPDEAFFRHLSERRFPAANFLRPPEAMEYSEEPDMFHDIFGHLPMLTNPDFAEFLVKYGYAGLRASKAGASDMLARLYLYTVEFGLVIENGHLRGYGAGLLSSLSETVHALTGSDVRRIYIDLPRMMATQYHFDRFQQVYFVVESFEQLLNLTEETDFASIYKRLENQPALNPDADHPDDVRCEITC